jgi:HSP20 family protein
MSPQSATAMQPTKSSAITKPDSSEDLFDAIYDSITQRAYELFDGNGRWPGNELANWFQAESEVLHPVHLELAESDDRFTVRAEVPGYSAKDLELRVEPNTVSIAGKRESAREEHDGHRKIHSERCCDQILRAVQLPVHIDTTKASATLKDGILMIDLPKAPHAKAVRIEPKQG